MRWNPIWIACVATLPVSAPGTGAAAQEGVQTVSLRRAIELAQLHSPQLAQTQASLINAGSTQRRAWGSFLPNISVSSGASVNSSSRFDPNTQRVVEGSSDSYNAGISANYQVFQGGRKYHELSRSGSARMEAEARLQSQRYAVVLQTTTLYINALRQRDLVAVSEGSVTRAEQSLEISKARFSGQAATRSDTLRTRLELANARQALLQARNQLRAAQFALGRQVGMDGPVAPADVGDLAPAPLQLSEVGDHRARRVGIPRRPSCPGRSRSGRLVARVRQKLVPAVPVGLVELLLGEPGPVALRGQHELELPVVGQLYALRRFCA